MDMPEELKKMMSRQASAEREKRHLSGWLNQQPGRLRLCSVPRTTRATAPMPARTSEDGSGMDVARKSCKLPVLSV